MNFLYNTGIFLYSIAIRLASLANKKARLFISGRKGLFKKIQKVLPGEHPVIWVHCASLGEFEQGRPLIEEIRKKSPSCSIVLTFFSPSGYEIRKKYEGADYIFYLPLDTPANARRFVALVKPSMALFVKYEFWFNYIRELNKNGIPLFVVSANFRANQHFFKWYGAWFRKNLKRVSHLFVQNEYSKKLLANAGIHHVTVSGDTRFDRVASITRQVKPFPLVEEFIQGEKVLVAGSSWKPDEEILVSFINKNPEAFKYIIAPHEIHREHIEFICHSLKVPYILYSELQEPIPAKARVLIVDCIGILSHLYRYGYISYIGGGFGKSIHNILEPATFGMPVIFGPNHTKFAEAIELKKLGGAFAINSAGEFEKLLLMWIQNPQQVETAAQISPDFVKKNTGACAIVMKELEKLPVIQP